ncbi:nucleotide disphospho-sugar-binding domain-containing protein [Streptomyces bungoensis]|uniref:nucleotide disphospho-sugar-binding domain-containing protein n=1 Tax=Streptomyces bungoensis TaxID=285568 RepID=UPI00342C9C67
MRVLFAARRSLPHLLAMAPTALACAAAGHEVRIAAPVPAGGLFTHGGLPAVLGTLPVLPPEPGWRPRICVLAASGDGPGAWPADACAARSDGAALRSGAHPGHRAGERSGDRPGDRPASSAGGGSGPWSGGPRSGSPSGGAAGPWGGGQVVHWSALDHRDPARAAGGGSGLWVDPCPPALRGDAEAGAFAVRHEDVPAVRLPEWLEQPPARARVCLRPGPDQGPGVWSAARVRQVARAVRDLDAELVAVVAPYRRHAYGQALGRGVRFAGPLLLGPVLATCAGVVHDGGPDVTLAAAAHGVPQLVLTGTRPAGDRLARIGAGRRLVAATPADARDMADALRLRRHLADLLHGGRALAAAERLRTRIAALPPPSALVGLLEDAAGGGSGRRPHPERHRTEPTQPQRHEEGERGT